MGQNAQFRVAGWGRSRALWSTAMDDATGAPDLDFSTFMAEAEPRVRRALVGLAGPEAASDATAEAFEYAWEHWSRVGPMANPAGYVYRVARSRVGRRRRRWAPGDLPGIDRLPDVEPALAGLLAALPERQRVCAFLVHG